jgi:hypothetical protein
MNFLDLLPDNLIEKINKSLIEAEIDERRKARKRRKKFKKRKNELQNTIKFVESY